MWIMRKYLNDMKLVEAMEFYDNKYTVFELSKIKKASKWTPFLFYSINKSLKCTYVFGKFRL